jgi:hypothetical protein
MRHQPVQSDTFDDPFTAKHNPMKPVGVRVMGGGSLPRKHKVGDSLRRSRWKGNASARRGLQCVDHLDRRTQVRSRGGLILLYRLDFLSLLQQNQQLCLKRILQL